MKTVSVLFAAAVLLSWSRGVRADGAGTGSAAPKPRHVVIKYEPEKEKIYKTIPLGVIDFATVEKVCRPWLSPGGLLINEEKRGSILVYDSPGVISRITDFLRQSDRKAPNIMVTFEYRDHGVANRTALDAAPGRDRKKGGRPAVRASVGGGSEQNLSTQFIVTRSGLPAAIWVGETRIDPSWLEFARRHPQRTVVAQNGKVVIDARTPPGPAVWTDVGASLQVRPTYREDGLIDLELFPEVRYLAGKGKQQTVKVAELTTRITVAEGQPVRIGGLIEAKREQYVNLFGPDFFRRDDISRVADMFVSARRAPGNSRFFSPPGGRTDQPVNGLPGMFRR